MNDLVKEAHALAAKFANPTMETKVNSRRRGNRLQIKITVEDLNTYSVRLAQAKKPKPRPL